MNPSYSDKLVLPMLQPVPAGRRQHEAIKGVGHLSRKLLLSLRLDTQSKRLHLDGGG